MKFLAERLKKHGGYLLVGLVAGFIIAGSTFVFAAENIKLIVNGKEIKSDVSPQLTGGRVLVPVRFVAENLGASVQWDGNQQAVIITTGSAPANNTQKTVNQNTAPNDPNQPEILSNYPGKHSGPPVKLGGAVYFPVTVNAENYGLITRMNNTTNSIEFPQSSVVVKLGSLTPGSDGFMYMGRPYIKESIITQAQKGKTS